MKNEFDPKYLVKCTSCNNDTYHYDFKITSTLYGNGLCNACELELIKSGFWTNDLKLQYIADRERFLQK